MELRGPVRVLEITGPDPQVDAMVRKEHVQFVDLPEVLHFADLLV
jgi:hypothetical protein